MAKILIIDDRPVNRQFLTTLLGYQHHELSEASDGAEGLRVARKQRPDLIISDVLMPTMDGYEFVRRLRQEPTIGKTPVIFSTAHYLSRESRALAEKCGVTSIIYKPCEPQSVLDTVAAALTALPEPELAAPALEPEEFDREHQQLLTNKLAEKTEQLRDAHGKLTALIELSSELAAERDPLELLDRYCSVAREVIGARWTLVVFLDGSRQAVQHLGAIGLEKVPDSPELRSALLSTGIFKTVIAEGRTICLSDVTSTPETLRLPKGLPRAGSLLVAPLAMRGRTYGWVCLADKLGLDAFSEQDERLANALAAKMAVAYDNARLYSDSVTYAGKLETEISQRTRIERELGENRARLAGIIDSAMDSIITVDSDQRVLMFNGAAEKMFRCTAGDVIGKSLDRFIPPRFRPSHAQDIRKFGETGFTTRAMGATRPISGLRADGEEFPLEASISQIEVGGQTLYTVIMRDITDKSRAQEGLQASELRYRRLFESSQDGILILDAVTGQIVDVNPFLTELLGYSKAELLGKELWEIGSFKDIVASRDAFNELQQHGFIRYENMPLETQGGIVKEVEFISNSYVAGRIRVIQCNIRDVSERKRAELALRESEEFSRRVIESSLDCIKVLDLEGHLLSMSSAGQQLLEIDDLEPLLHKSWIDFWELKDRERVRAAVAKAERGGVGAFRAHCPTTKGTPKWWDVIITPITNAAGKPERLLAVSRDVTNQTRIEEALRQSEEQYRTMANSIPQLAWMAHADGFIFWYNQRWHDYTGKTPAEMEGWGWQSVHDPDVLPKVLEKWRGAISSGQPFEMEFPLLGADGRFRTFLTRGQPLKDSQGAVVQWFGTNTDVDELRRAKEATRSKNEELTAMTQQLWHASKLATMGELAASIAHELNNPLATVGLRTETLLMQLPADSDQRKPLEIIAQEVDRMANLVNNLLQFSRRSHRQVSTVDPCEEIATSVEFVHYHLRSHNIEVVCEFADSLPTIQADRQQLRQLFLNLLTNASDAMPQGGKLTVRATSNGSHGAAVAIDFADTGEGISAENLEKIWEPFFTTKPEGKGTGLGLAICRRIVDEHGGTLDIQSEGAGCGTTVHIVLPATSNGPSNLP